MDPLKSESVPEVNFEVSEDDNQGRKTTGSEGRAALALKAIRDKEEKAKRLIRERMEEGLKKVLDLHNAVELSSMCGSLNLPVQERRHVSYKAVLEYAVVKGAIKADRLKRVLDCCWEEPLVTYIREELNPHFHRAKDPATIVMHWWKEGGLVSDQSTFNPHFIWREVKKSDETVKSADLIAKLALLHDENEKMKVAERNMFSVKNYASITNYFDTMRHLRKQEVGLREWLVKEVEINRSRLDVVDEVVHYGIKNETECLELQENVTNEMAQQLARSEMYAADLQLMRYCNQASIVAFREYVDRLTTSCDPFHAAFPDAPFDVRGNSSRLSHALDRLHGFFKRYKHVRDKDGANHIERRRDNEMELARLEGLRGQLSDHLSFLKRKAFWEEQQCESELLGLRKAIQDDIRLTELNRSARAEAWETNLRYAARARDLQMQRRDLYPLVRQGLLGTNKSIIELCYEINEVFDVVGPETLGEIERIQEMGQEEMIMRKYLKDLAVQEKKRAAAAKKKAAAKASKKGGAKGKGKKGGDDASKTSKSTKASSKGGSKKSDKGAKGKKGGKPGSKKKPDGDDASKASTKKSAKSDAKSAGSKKTKGKKKK